MIIILLAIIAVAAVVIAVNHGTTYMPGPVRYRQPTEHERLFQELGLRKAILMYPEEARRQGLIK